MTFPFLDSSAPSSSAGEGMSSLAGFMRSGDANRAFLLLDASVQDQIIAHIEGLSPAAQSDLFARLGTFNIEQLIGLVDGNTPAAAAVPTVAAGTSSAAPATASGRTYTVQAGDSLWKIARAHAISLAQLVAANPQIENPDRIFPHQVIHLP